MIQAWIKLSHCVKGAALSLLLVVFMAGLSATWDYGPLGVELSSAIFRIYGGKHMTRCHDNIVGLDAAILMHPKTWEASGHVDNFSDPLTDCKKCKMRYRTDHLVPEVLTTRKCPSCGGENDGISQF